MHKKILSLFLGILLIMTSCQQAEAPGVPDPGASSSSASEVTDELKGEASTDLTLRDVQTRKQSDLVPNRTVLFEDEEWVTFRFNLAVQSDRQEAYLVSDVTFPIGWKEWVQQKPNADTDKFYMVTRTVDYDNTYMSRKKTTWENSPDFEQIFEKAINDRYWLCGIKSDSVYRELGNGEYAPCSEYRHWVFYYTKYAQEIIQVCFFVGPVDPEVCVPEETLKLQEEILSSWVVHEYVRLIED